MIQAFERYATGSETIDSIKSFLANNGIRSHTGKSVGTNLVENLFSNPLYFGHFRYAGEIYEGVHEPLISKRLFDDVRAVFAERFRYSTKKPNRIPKAFTGLMHCADCGFSITAEVQKGHTYYRCTKRNKAQLCSQPYVREEVLEVEISKHLSTFALHETPELTTFLADLDATEKLGARDSTVLIATKRKQIESINLKIRQLLDMRLDGEIDSATYVERKAKLMSQRKTLDEQITALTRGRSPWLEPFKEWLNEARAVGEIACKGSLTEKRVLAKKIFGSNLVLDGKKARGEAVKPWAFLADNELSHDMVHILNTARTFFQEGHAS